MQPLKKSAALLLAACCIALAGCGKSVPAAATPQSAVSVSSQTGVSQGDVSSDAAGVAVSSAAAVASAAGSSSKHSSASSVTSTAAAQPKPTASVLVPEGYSLSQIGKALETKGVCSQSDFLAAINHFDCSSYPNAAKIPYDPSKRCYKLEGYLYPDTYTFYLNMKPNDVIAKMLRNEETKIGSKYSYPGMSTDEIITLASIIQKEAARYDDMQNVSCVFHNRLNKGMALQADSTVYYLTIPYIPQGLVDTYKAYYNTVRRCKALPAGAICSPGALALKAAVNPANQNYLYFASDAAKNYYFAATYDEQLQNCKAHGISSPELDSQPQS